MRGKYNKGKPLPKRENTWENYKNIKATVELIINKWKENAIYWFMIILSAIFMSIIALGIAKGAEIAKQNKTHVIERPYTEILREVKDNPTDITEKPYQENMPKIIQKDIVRMLTMGEDAKIIYYGKNKLTKIIIKPDSNADKNNGYIITFEDAYNSWLFSDREITTNISFYKEEDTLVIYGGTSNNRIIKKYVINDDEVDYTHINNDKNNLYGYVDLFGVDQEFENVRYFYNYFTLVREDNNFAFYHLGKRISETTFEGGKIKSWDYDYLLTEEGACYKVYISAAEAEPWIKFFKLADSVEEILEEETTTLDSNSYELSFPILKINGKKYGQLPDAETERAYGQNYGTKHNISQSFVPNFETELVELNIENATKVQLITTTYGLYESIKEWRIIYYFSSGGRECFVSKRINGIDNELYDQIPSELLSEFDGKTISSDQIEKTINELKELYEKYADNKF